jgi:hypothetical protein
MKMAGETSNEKARRPRAKRQWVLPAPIGRPAVRWLILTASWGQRQR